MASWRKPRYKRRMAASSLCVSWCSRYVIHGFAGSCAAIDGYAPCCCWGYFTRGRGFSPTGPSCYCVPFSGAASASLFGRCGGCASCAPSRRCSGCAFFPRWFTSPRATRRRHAHEHAAAGSIISAVLPLLLSGLGPSIGPAASLSADPSAGHILLVIYQRSRLLKDERLGSVRGPWTKMRLPLFPITPLSAMLLFTFSQMGSAVIWFMLKFLESPRRCFPVQVRNHALVIQISRL